MFLSLITVHPSGSPYIPYGGYDSSYTKTTLVICPANVISTWEDEIKVFLILRCGY